ncbi:thioredoxin [Clostridium septicum]|uniref:Thioredoxin n=1 Tax=Clostridium septicum TaxID=1504 RepID=A0A9N7JKU7_CLOSE|nr:thioredoxin [Clostridium septicum]AYE33726.1 thioredoxin [Clostridium septicum]MDU1313775.1 thioredoxin [Clostridium septicum]QAS61883.1 thioredoxin [Clostridium septicum]UEC21662.1 thioredoxin [Clostridium septicum]USS00287.1 thioredoxin [Clostridium septicum]
MVKHINEQEFDLEVLKEKGVVVVDFFATWCGPCKMLAPVLEDVQSEMSDIKIVKINIDENQKAAETYGVTNIPTIKIFKEGKEVTTKVGFQHKDALIQMIKQSM